MKKIYACSEVCGKLSTLYIFESKRALISYAMNNGRGEATEGKPTIAKLLKALGLTRVYARELSKYKKLNLLHRFN
jgi:hypothetical protein